MRISPQDRTKILGCLQEISASMTRVEAERDLLKDIYTRMQDEFELPKKLSRKLAKTYHKRNFTEEVADQEEFNEVYSAVAPGSDSEE